MPMCLIKHEARVSLGSHEDQSRLTPKKKIHEREHKIFKKLPIFFFKSNVKK